MGEKILFNIQLANKSHSVVPSQITKDFPKNISAHIRQMADNGEIKLWHCYANACKVAQYLVDNGYDNINIADGYYKGPKNWDINGTHRFIQYVHPNGVVRYYDPSAEFLPRMRGTWNYTYYVYRIISLEDINRFNEIVNTDLLTNCPMGYAPNTYYSTLDRGCYETKWTETHPYINPFIDDNGIYHSIISVAEEHNYSLSIA